MGKKYELVKDDYIEHKGRILYRIRALKDFGYVKAGDLGGYIESEKNLSHEGNCWVFKFAKVYENAQILDNAIVDTNNEAGNEAEVYGNAIICENAHISWNAKVYDNAIISGRAFVSDNVLVFGNAMVSGDVVIEGESQICGNVDLFGPIDIDGNARIGVHTVCD